MTIVIKTLLIGIILILWWRMVRFVYISYRAMPKFNPAHNVSLTALTLATLFVLTVIALAFALPIYHFNPDFSKVP